MPAVVLFTLSEDKCDQNLLFANETDILDSNSKRQFIHKKNNKNPRAVINLLCCVVIIVDGQLLKYDIIQIKTRLSKWSVIFEYK